MEVANNESSRQYLTTTVTGNATAILGDKYGDIINIQQATFLLSSTTVSRDDDGPRKVVRQNRILDGHTLETVTSYSDGHILTDRGTSHAHELRWDRREDLGVGVFGEVHREECQDGHKTKSRAVKVLRRKQLEHMRIDYKKELDALIQLSHPEYVHRYVEFYSWYESEDNIYLAMEYIHHGDLEKYIESGLTETDARQIAYQVLDGIRVMHRLDFIHRDIKPANIFVVQHQPVWWVKIGDFSIAKSTITRHTNLHTQVGTQGYQAPEILGLVPGEKPDQYSAKCDVWSFGCLMYEMLTKRLPFPDIGSLTRFCDDESLFPRLPLRRSGASWITGEFTWTMLQADPDDRPTADQAAFLLTCRCDLPSVESAPFHVGNHIYFTDCVGRHFKVPRDDCQTYEHMQSVIWKAVSYIEHVRPRLKSRTYQLLDAASRPVRPEDWVSLVQAGSRITMKLTSRSLPPTISEKRNNLVSTPSGTPNQRLGLSAKASQPKLEGVNSIAPAELLSLNPLPQIKDDVSEARPSRIGTQPTLDGTASANAAANGYETLPDQNHRMKSSATSPQQPLLSERRRTNRALRYDSSPAREKPIPMQLVKYVDLRKMYLDRYLYQSQLILYVDLQKRCLDYCLSSSASNTTSPPVTKGEESPEVHDITYLDELTHKAAFLTGGDMLDFELLRRLRISEDTKSPEPGEKIPLYRCQNGEYIHDRYGSLHRPVYSIETGGYTMNLETFTSDLLHLFGDFINRRTGPARPRGVDRSTYIPWSKSLKFIGKIPPETGTVYLIDCTNNVGHVPWVAGDSWNNVFEFLVQQIDDPILTPWIRKGFFDIVDDRTGEVLTPLSWSYSVAPRRPLRMRMWYAFDDIPGRRPNQHVALYDRKYKSSTGIIADRYMGDLDLWRTSASSLPSRPNAALTKPAFINLVDFLGRNHKVLWKRRGMWRALQDFIYLLYESLNPIVGGRNIAERKYDLYCLESQTVLTEVMANEWLRPGAQIYMILWPCCNPVLRTLYRRILTRLTARIPTSALKAASDEALASRELVKKLMAVAAETVQQTAFGFSDPVKVFETFAEITGDRECLDLLQDPRVASKRVKRPDGTSGEKKQLPIRAQKQAGVGAGNSEMNIHRTGAFSFRDPAEVFAQFAQTSGDDEFLSMLRNNNDLKPHLGQHTVINEVHPRRTFVSPQTSYSESEEQEEDELDEGTHWQGGYPNTIVQGHERANVDGRDIEPWESVSGTGNVTTERPRASATSIAASRTDVKSPTSLPPHHSGRRQGRREASVTRWVSSEAAAADQPVSEEDVLESLYSEVKDSRRRRRRRTKTPRYVDTEDSDLSSYDDEPEVPTRKRSGLLALAAAGATVLGLKQKQARSRREVY